MSKFKIGDHAVVNSGPGKGTVVEILDFAPRFVCLSLGEQAYVTTPLSPTQCTKVNVSTGGVRNGGVQPGDKIFGGDSNLDPLVNPDPPEETEETEEPECVIVR